MREVKSGGKIPVKKSHSCSWQRKRVNCKCREKGRKRKKKQKKRYNAELLIRNLNFLTESLEKKKFFFCSQLLFAMVDVTRSQLYTFFSIHGHNSVKQKKGDKRKKEHQTRTNINYHGKIFLFSNEFSTESRLFCLLSFHTRFFFSVASNKDTLLLYEVLCSDPGGAIKYNETAYLRGKKRRNIFECISFYSIREYCIRGWYCKLYFIAAQKFLSFF